MDQCSQLVRYLCTVRTCKPTLAHAHIYSVYKRTPPFVHTHMHTHIHTCVCTHAHTHTHTHAHTHTCTLMHTRTYACTYARTHACTHTHTKTFMLWYSVCTDVTYLHRHIYKHALLCTGILVPVSVYWYTNPACQPMLHVRLCRINLVCKCL